MCASKLSARGTRAQARPFSYFDAFVATFSDAYDAKANPEGFVNLAVAQNVLCMDEMHERVNRAFVESPSSSTSAMYDDMKGSRELKEAFAGHINSRWTTEKLACRAEDLVLSSGAGALIENLCFCLCDEGDAIIIPAPYYPAFPNDLRARMGIDVVPVYAEKLTSLPTPADYEAVVTPRCKAILLCNPGNPTGVIFDKESVMDTIEWATSKGLHVISDEIYAASSFGSCLTDEFLQRHSMRNGRKAGDHRTPGMHSGMWGSMAILDRKICAELEEEERVLAMAERVHVIYGLSKDFCASGYRVGVLWTRNAAVHRALDNVSYFCAIPGPMQHALATVLNDDDFIPNFIIMNSHALAAQFASLDHFLSVPAQFVQPDAGMFVWFSLRNFLPSSPTWEDEKKLWQHVYDVAKVVLTPGADCAMNEPGWFRMCFAAVDRDTLQVAVHRIEAALKASKM